MNTEMKIEIILRIIEIVRYTLFSPWSRIYVIRRGPCNESNIPKLNLMELEPFWD
jgi:hypothetical protein